MFVYIRYVINDSVRKIISQFYLDSKKKFINLITNLNYGNNIVACFVEPIYCLLHNLPYESIIMQ